VAAEGRARSDQLRLDCGEAPVDEQAVAGEQQRDPGLAPLGRAQKFSTIAL
jgi:hypothetical protein